jgi:Bacterial Ig-like domain (group 3)
MASILRVSLCVVLFCATSLVARSQTFTFANAMVGSGDNEENLCVKSALEQISCYGRFRDADAIGVGAASVDVSPLKVRLGANVSLSNNGGLNEAITAQASGTYRDEFVVADLSQSAFLFVVVELSATSEGSTNNSILMDAGTNNNSCQIVSFGTSLCPFLFPLTPSLTTVSIYINLTTTASLRCSDAACRGGTASVSAGRPSPGGMTFLAVTVVDENIVPLQGPTVTSASGVKYRSKFASTAALASSQPASGQGEPVIFAATVASLGRPQYPTGKVLFRDLTSSTILGSAPLNGGAATFTTSTLSSGSHSIVGIYSGDPLCAGSKSAVLLQQVN